MRQLAFLLYGLVLLALDGALCQVFHLEWIRPDPVLILNVFIAISLPPAEGIVMIFVLGIFADSHAGTPAGMLTVAHMLTWLFLRGSKQMLLPDQTLIQLGLLFIGTLFYHLLLVALLVVMDSGSGPMWVSVKAMVPVAIVHVVLAVPLWKLAKKIRRPPSQIRSLGVS